MKTGTFAKIAVGVSLCAVFAMGLIGCAQEEDAQVEDALTTDTGLTGGIAATVNGVEIEEDRVTRAINNIRLSNNLAEVDEWKDYLKNNNETPESIREMVIDSFVDQELVVQCADQLGVTTDDEEVQGYVDKMRENYSSDESWETALDGAGFEDEDAYKEALQYSIRDKKLTELFEQQAETTATDEAVVEELQSQRATYDGAKRSSQILFSEDDEELAKEVADKIRRGDLTMADAAAQYSTDEGSKGNGGDVGWDKTTTFVSEYQTALDELSVNQVSAPTKSKYGYHVIQCTDVWNAPETITSLSEVPEDIVSTVRSTMESDDASDAKDEWLKQVREQNDVVINPMPEGLPYDVDMDDVESTEEQEEIDANAEAESTSDIASTENAVGAAEADADSASLGADVAETGEAADTEGIGADIEATE